MNNQKLLDSQPGEEETIGLNIFPVGNKAAGHLFTIAAQQVFQFFTVKPLLPFGCVQASPLLGVFVDDDNPAAWLYHPAHLVNRLTDLDCVLERLGGVGAIEE